MKTDGPFHAGELQAQRLAGETAPAERNGTVISDSIMAGALNFLRQQQMVVFGTESGSGALWASPLFGLPGFVNPENVRSLHFDRNRLQRVETDPFWENLRPGARAGMLAIELSTRRRLRVNGEFESVTDTEFVFAVREAYPNCPKYIQRRTLTWDDDAPRVPAPPALSGTFIEPVVAELLDAADTLFIATIHRDRGADASHRGGNPGFIQRLDARTLRVPDYAGNSLFNTFGNLLVDSRAGVTVMDFSNLRMLQMTGRAEVDWNAKDEQKRTGGTGRFWMYEIDQWRLLSFPRSARWEFLDASPFNPQAW